MTTLYHDKLLNEGSFGEIYVFISSIMEKELPSRPELGIHFGSNDPDPWTMAFLFFRSLDKKPMTSVRMPEFEDQEHRRLNARVIRLCQECEDDAEFERKLRTAVRQWLSDRFDETDYGLVRRTLERDMETHDEFEKVQPYQYGSLWHLAGYPSSVTAISLDGLWTVAVANANIRWPSDDKLREYLKKRNNGIRARRPNIEREPVRSLLRAILKAANGAVKINTMTDIFINLHPAIAPVHHAAARFRQYDGEYDMENIADAPSADPANQWMDREYEREFQGRW